MINASVSVNYVDGHSAHFRVVGISDSRHSISYEVVSAEPNMSVSSVQNEIKLYPVTDTDHTFIRWITDFSNDVDLQMIEDNKYKKLECFSAMQTYFSTLK